MEIREQLTGEYGYGKQFTVSTCWVKENDPGVYDYLHNLMVEFLNDESNRTHLEDLEDFENGKWIVEYVFRGYGEASTEILITAGKDNQHIANQPAWIQEVVDDKDLEVYWEVDTYLKMIGGGIKC